jgi:uncharacterized membrane protein
MNYPNPRLTDFKSNPIYQYSLLIAITLLATVLRFYKLGQWSFWIDEMFTLRDVQNVFGGTDWPPISLVLIGTTLTFLDTSEWNARLAPALIGVVSIPLLYSSIRKMFGPAVALLAVLLLAVSPWHLFWSQNVRFYTALMIFYTLALFAFYFGLEEDRPWYMILSVFALALSLQERLIALFFIPVVLSYLVLLTILPFEKTPGFRIRNLIPVLLLGVVYGLYMTFSVSSSEDTSQATVLATKFFGISRYPPRVLASVVYWIGVPLFCLALFGGIYLMLTQRKQTGLFLFLGALVPVLALLLIAPFARVDARYVFISLPCWVILGAVGVKELFSQVKGQGKVLAVGVLVLLLADSISQDVLYYNHQNGNRRDWKGAFALVQQKKVDGDLVVTNRIELGEYYLGKEVLWSQGMHPQTIMQSGKKAWFLISDGTISVSPDLQRWLNDNSQLIDVRDVHIPGRNYMLRVYLYDPAQSIEPLLSLD